MSKTKIEWAEKTINFHTGCNKVSRGCKHCYAQTQCDGWLSNWKNTVYYGRKFLDGPVFHPERLRHKDLSAKKPTSFFVNSMSDFFHADNRDEDLSACWQTMIGKPQHQFLVLTKRAREMHEWVTAQAAIHGVPMNIWLGVSAEDREHWEKRVPYLQMTPAVRRFVSAEPLIEDLGQIDLAMIDWVIVGGESGGSSKNLARMDLRWAQSIAEQCTAAGTCFFFKQLGTLEARRIGVGGKGGEEELDGYLRETPFYDEHPYLYRRETPRWTAETTALTA